MNDVHQYLTLVSTMRRNSHLPPGFKYSCMEEFVLKHGKFLGGRSEKSDNYPKGTMKECFLNSFHLSLENKDLIYCEGYAMGIIPVLHAWCIDKDGHVIDVTWNDGTEYIGVFFHIDYVKKVILKKQSYGIIDNFEMKWPLLRGEHFEDLRC